MECPQTRHAPKRQSIDRGKMPQVFEQHHPGIEQVHFIYLIVSPKIRVWGAQWVGLIISRYLRNFMA